MGDGTRIIADIERGDRVAAGQLLPLIDDELHRLAARRLAPEAPGQSLQAAALVHAAYLRLIDGDPDRPFDGRGHYFAAAEAMRRIRIDRARRRPRRRACPTSVPPPDRRTPRAVPAGRMTRSGPW
jgi:hypothetical protein